MRQKVIDEAWWGSRIQFGPNDPPWPRNKQEWLYEFARLHGVLSQLEELSNKLDSDGYLPFTDANYLDRLRDVFANLKRAVPRCRRLLADERTCVKIRKCYEPRQLHNGKCAHEGLLLTGEVALDCVGRFFDVTPVAPQLSVVSDWTRIQESEQMLTDVFETIEAQRVQYISDEICDLRYGIEDEVSGLPVKWPPKAKDGQTTVKSPTAEEIGLVRCALRRVGPKAPQKSMRKIQNL